MRMPPGRRLPTLRRTLGPATQRNWVSQRAPALDLHTVQWPFTLVRAVGRVPRAFSVPLYRHCVRASGWRAGRRCTLSRARRDQCSQLSRHDRLPLVGVSDCSCFMNCRPEVREPIGFALGLQVARVLKPGGYRVSSSSRHTVRSSAIIRHGRPAVLSGPPTRVFTRTLLRGTYLVRATWRCS